MVNQLFKGLLCGNRMENAEEIHVHDQESPLDSHHPLSPLISQPGMWRKNSTDWERVFYEGNQSGVILLILQNPCFSFHF